MAETVEENTPDNKSPLSQEKVSVPADNLVNYVKTQQTTTPVNERVNSEVAGDYQKGAKPTPADFSTEAHVNAVSDFFKNTADWAPDKLAYSKPFTYGAGWRNMNFDRYYASSGFKKLGFDPYADNEAVYNKNTSSWVDMNRALPQIAKGAWLGFKGMLTPWSTDEDADKQQKMFAIGSSSRGGVSGFVTNLGLNAGYTLGIIGEAVGEEALLTAATIGSLGTASEATLPFMGAEAARAGSRIYEGWKGLNSVKKAFDAVKTANDARKLYELAKTGTKAVAKWLLPAETATFTYDALKGLNGIDKLSTYAKIHKGVGSFVRDLREIKAVASESELEGGSVQTERNEELIHKFFEKNGRLPDEDESQKIFESAKESGQLTAWSNMPLIYLSNKFVLDNALKGFKPLKALFREEGELPGTIIKDQAAKAAGEGPYKAVSSFSLAAIKSGIKPYNLLKGSLRYGTANLAEALQESAQEVVSSAYKNYYDKVYEDPELAGSHSLASSFAKGMNDQFTSQGFDTFASGFFMGGLIQGPQKVLFEKIPQAFHKITNPQQYQEYKQAKDKYINSVLEAMNDVELRPSKYVNAIHENFVNQKRAATSLTETEQDADRKAHKDAQDEAIFDHVYTLLRSGHEHILTDQIKNLKELKPNELAEAFNRDVDDHDSENKPLNDKLQSFEDKVGYLKKRYETIEKQFPNPFDPKKINQERDSAAYENEARNKNVFDFYKKQILFSHYTFDRTLERMRDITADISASKPLEKASLTDVSLLFDLPSMGEEIKSLKTELSAYNQSPEISTKKIANQKREKLESLQDLQDSIHGYMTALKLRSSAEVKAGAKDQAELKAKMTPGTRVITKKGENLKIKGVHKDGQRLILENKKLYNFKSLTLAKESKVEGFNMDGFVSEHLSILKDSFDSYMRHLAHASNDHVIDSKINSAFDKLKDYYALQHESFQMASAINALTNPERSHEIFGRYVEAKKILDAQRLEKLKKALEVFMQKMEHNDLLNALYKIGVYFDPSEIDSFINDNKIPDAFYDAVTSGKIEKSSDKFKEIEKVLEKYNKIVRPDVVDKIEKEKVQKEKELLKSKQTPTGIIYISRHGSNSDDAEGVVSGSTAPPLSEEGKAEVRKELKAITDENVQKVISSPVVRAKESGEIIAKNKKAELVTDDRLFPWNVGDEQTGFAKTPDEDWDKLSAWFANNPTEKVYAGVDVDNEGVKLSEKYAGHSMLESFDELKTRVIPAIKDIVNNSPDDTAVVTHSNITQLIKAYAENGKVNNDNLNQLFVTSPPLRNGELLPLERNEISPLPAAAIVVEQSKEVPFDLVNKLENITNGEELKNFEKEIISKLANYKEANKLGLDADAIGLLIERKKQELATLFNYDDVKVGNVLAMVDPRYDLMIVLSKTAREIKLRKVGEETGPVLVVRKSTLHRDVKYKYSGEMDTTKGGPSTVSAEESKISDVSIDNIKDLSEDEEALKEAETNAVNKTPEQLKQDLIDKLGCK